MPTSESTGNQASAAKLLTQIVFIFGTLAFVCIAGGIVAIVLDAREKTEFELLGAHLKTGHVGIAFVGIGLLMAYFTVKSVLKNQRFLASLATGRKRQEANSCQETSFTGCDENNIAEPISVGKIKGKATISTGPTFLNPPSDQTEGNSLPCNLTASDLQGRPVQFGRRTPTPADIMKALDELPPLQHDDAAKHYADLPIDWDLSLFSARRNSGSTVAVTFVAEGIDGIITCQVPLPWYPELAIMKKDTKIRVVGRIAKVHSPCVDLKDVQLNY